MYNNIRHNDMESPDNNRRCCLCDKIEEPHVRKLIISPEQRSIDIYKSMLDTEMIQINHRLPKI